VLKLLRDEFSAAGWQLVLLTHDKVWYDYASHAAMGLDWACYELYADRAPDGAGGWHDLPLLRSPREGAGDYLQRANEQMRLHDYKAAGMYARAAYERELRRFCGKRQLLIPFHLDAEKIASNTFFQAVKADVNDAGRKVGGVVTPVPATVLSALNANLADIELHRQQVLNPMSHAPVVPLTGVEIQAAIDAVEALINVLQTVLK
jgi:hypothetical protein